MENGNQSIHATHRDLWEIQDVMSGAHIGLTKREHFANSAMQTLLTKYPLTKPEDQETICRMAVQLSDELLKQLK